MQLASARHERERLVRRPPNFIDQVLEVLLALRATLLPAATSCSALADAEEQIARPSVFPCEINGSTRSDTYVSFGQLKASAGDPHGRIPEHLRRQNKEASVGAA